MRRLSALVAAAAILVMLLPATSLAARADRFEVQQVDFINMLRPTDLIMDARSNLYVTSLSAGGTRFACASAWSW